MPDNADTRMKDIHELFEEVRSHPDFVFGTIFVTGDFPKFQVPQHFYDHQASDRLAELGNEMISDECGDEESSEFDGSETPDPG